MPQLFGVVSSGPAEYISSLVTPSKYNNDLLRTCLWLMAPLLNMLGVWDHSVCVGFGGVCPSGRLAKEKFFFVFQFTIREDLSFNLRA